MLLIHCGLMEPMSGERFWIALGIIEDLTVEGYRTLVAERRYHVGGLLPQRTRTIQSQ